MAWQGASFQCQACSKHNSIVKSPAIFLKNIKTFSKGWYRSIQQYMNIGAGCKTIRAANNLVIWRLGILALPWGWIVAAGKTKTGRKNRLCVGNYGIIYPCEHARNANSTVSFRTDQSELFIVSDIGWSAYIYQSIYSRFHFGVTGKFTHFPVNISDLSSAHSSRRILDSRIWDFRRHTKTLHSFKTFQYFWNLP